ncbi:transposable element gene [Prunus dulcis]|uniref:Transposable element protein n=1 Tax=Prunus dulcis TaxID=3755 RepID=A0A4Y1R889_PRUDU|nr:transposable element gene [Prunus dulcis]
MKKPYIAYAVSVVSQFMHSASEDHLAAIMRILSLIFKKLGHLDVKSSTDGDWAYNITHRSSTSGYFTFIGGILVTWRSKKQNVVARSSAEAEYRGIAQGVCELLWLGIILSEIDFPPKKVMELYCDNQAVREIANNLVRRMLK